LKKYDIINKKEKVKEKKYFWKLWKFNWIWKRWRNRRRKNS